MTKVYLTASKHYHLPNSFIPERWTTQPNLLINREAFAPFSLGKPCSYISFHPTPIYLKLMFSSMNRSLQLHRP